MRIIVSENEKVGISTQHDEIDRNLFNFLVRRIKIKKRKFGGNWGDFEPLEVTEYTFEGHPSYGFTSYESKKTMENEIIRMLFENDIIEDVYDMDERDPERVKIVKTIRNFLNFVLKDKK